MRKSKKASSVIEILEARIAPASVSVPILNAVWRSANSGTSTGTGNASFELSAGEGLSSSGPLSGTYWLYVEKGNAIVFATDLNNNGILESDEVTGIAAGDGLRLISFVDIHGDIVTNLKETTVIEAGANGVATPRTVLTLSDSDFNPTNDFEADGRFRGDGRLLLNNTIEKIELRSLTPADLPDQNGDGRVDALDVSARQAVSHYSIYGNIYAGRGFGASDGGLIVDSTGQIDRISPLAGLTYQAHPLVNAIKVGTAASGEYFSFGPSNQNDVQGELVAFSPALGAAGGSIDGVKTLGTTTTLNIGSLLAGDGGQGGAGGDVKNVALATDDTGGYVIKAGNGGRGATGGNGGSILNFSDSGSVTGQILIKSGNGGTGSNGPGGAAGNVKFGTFNVRGDVALKLGNGAAGFTAGGAGASLAGGRISTPENVQAQGLAALGVTNLADTSSGIYTPKIGIQEGIDFNGDGFGDIVLTTGESTGGAGKDSRSQLFVMLGDGFGGWLPFQGLNTDGFARGIYLPGLRNPDAITVADFNGDGHPDIAVASSDHGQAAGVVVYLSKFVELNGDGVSTPDEFVGFSDGRFSPINNSILDYLPNFVQVNKLAAGDFGGVDPVTGLDTPAADGRVELAVIMTVNPAPFPIFQQLGFMQQDYENGKPTGQFYFDYGRKGDPTAQPAIAPVPRNPFFTLNLGDGDTADVKATALADGNFGSTPATHDVVLVSHRDTNDHIRTIDYLVRNDPLFGAVPPEVIGTFNPGKVDTDRMPNTPGKTDHQNLVNATVHDFTIADLTGPGDAPDGLADVGFITKAPVGFFVGIQGDGSGNGTPNSGAGDNAGNFIIGDTALELVAITSGDFDGNGIADDLGIAFIDPISPTDPVSHYHYMSDADGAALISTFYPFAIVKYDDTGTNSSTAYTTFIVNVADITTATSGAGYEEGSGVYFPVPATVGGALVFVSSIAYTNDQFVFNAGDGGLSLTGSGGAGGFFGGALTRGPSSASTALGSINLEGAIEFNNKQVPVSLTAGNGGDGFVSGGKGGSISGVAIVQEPGALWPSSQLVGGDGGRGVTGVGGAGGDVFNNTVDGGATGSSIVTKGRYAGTTGNFFAAGDGGVGYRGGKGGSVIGQGSHGFVDSTPIDGGGVQIVGYYDVAFLSLLTVLGGAGGGGVKAGGSAGGILNFASAPYGTSAIRFVAAPGGNATSGPGGAGGSVTSSSPLVNNFLDRDIWIQSGAGGDGVSGGAGGSIVDFAHRPASGVDTAQFVSLLAGNGGNGSGGIGGTGGGISNITVPSSGVAKTPPILILDKYAFNRMIAGNGGNSSSAAGGRGGSVQNVLTSAQQSSYAVVSGAGGNGLNQGGAGGSLASVEISIGAGPFAQSLLVAGAGGDASAFLSNSNDTAVDQARKAFGGVIGKGGNGGDITGTRQRGASQAHVNLIAGNGGDSIHYGTVYDAKPFVGSGGSVTNVVVTGDIGNTTPDDPAIAGNQAVPIKSYNDILNGQSMAKWVDLKFINNPAFVVSLDDTDGNVGLVVGAAGRNKAVVLDPVNSPGVYRSQPASNALNGSLINLTAKNLMSAVAGSVDRIASIYLAQGIKVPPGIIGSEKGEAGAGTPNYLDQFGNPTEKNGDVTRGEPVLEGKLIDGALVAKKILDLAGNQITLPGKVYPR